MHNFVNSINIIAQAKFFFTMLGMFLFQTDCTDKVLYKYEFQNNNHQFMAIIQVKLH